MRQVTCIPGSITWKDSLIAITQLFDSARAQEGRAVREYETAFKCYLGAEHAFAFGSGRTGLSAILTALEIGQGDEVILPGITCVVVPNAIQYTGAVPIFVDIDSGTYNIDYKEIESRITDRTKAIIVQHTFGLPADLDPIVKLAGKHDLLVIEDCAHALGAEYKGQKVGLFGDASFFSMEQSKVISTGMGGVAVTNDASVAEKIQAFQQECAPPAAPDVGKLLRQLVLLDLLFRPVNFTWGTIAHRLLDKRHAFVAPLAQEEYVCEKPPHYEKSLTNAQAKVGLNQLRNLETNLRHRREMAGRYRRGLAEMGFAETRLADNVRPVYLRYAFVVSDKPRAVAAARKHQIGFGTWFNSVIYPEECSLERTGYKLGSCPRAEDAVEHVINFPTHLKVTARDVDRIIRFVRTETGLSRLSSRMPGKHILAVADKNRSLRT